jgi:hypothetical protein
MKLGVIMKNNQNYHYKSNDYIFYIFIGIICAKSYIHQENHKTICYGYRIYIWEKQKMTRKAWFGCVGMAWLMMSVSFAPAWAYNHYFGTIHSHSGYSDGNQAKNSSYKTAYQAFQFAKNRAGLDFMAITDHNHSDAGMAIANFDAGLKEANDATVNGEFVAIYGIEWGTLNDDSSNGGGGHVNYYGADSLFGWESGNYDVFVKKGDYASLFAKILAYPSPAGGIAQLNHPESNDFGGLFNHYDATADEAISLIEIMGGPAFSQNTTLTDPGSEDETLLKTSLALGYHLSPSASQDNHYANWGLSNEQRTVILANSLNKESILEALQQGRCYASQDMNASVDFSVDGHVMGERITTAATELVINVNVADLDQENVKTIEIYSGVSGSKIAAKSIASASNRLSATFSQTGLSEGIEYYYYARIVQSDNDIIVTAPVWVVWDQEVVDPGSESGDDETDQSGALGTRLDGCGDRLNGESGGSNNASGLLLTVILGAGLCYRRPKQ